MTCYLQTNRGDWAQETYETASRDAGRRVRQLRKAGYLAVSSGIGPQVTRLGTVRMTLVNIRPGVHRDTFDLPTKGWIEKRI